MAEEETKSLITEILGKEKNSNCFDCGKHRPTWFSIRHSVFVCTDCAAKHRSIGLRLKSALLDNFTKEDIKRARVGGNFFYETSEFGKKYENLKSLPEKIDKLLESYEEDVSSEKSEAEEKKLVVKEKVAAKFGTRVAKTERVPRSAAAESLARSDAGPKLKSVRIKQEELLVSRKEYKIGEADKSRIGLGISKVREKKNE